MYKKGVFFSLTVVLFLVFLIILFNARAKQIEAERDLHLTRAQIIVLDHYVRDFDAYYIQQILRNSATHAFEAATAESSFTPFTKLELVDIMKNGFSGTVSMDIALITNEFFERSLGTLTFTLEDKVFDFKLNSVEQTEYDKIILNFNVTEYRFEQFDSIWKKNNIAVEIEISIYGLTHPFYGYTIDDSWLEDSSGCYIEDIMSDTNACAINIMPPSV